MAKEKTPTFIVNVAENIWYDHTEGTEGNLITFVCFYLERQGEEHTVIDALRWIKYITGIVSIPEPLEKSFDEEDSVLCLKSKKSIRNIGLIHYL